jgi:hypothetical protein
LKSIHKNVGGLGTWNLKKISKIIKSIKETENGLKNSNFNLGRNPLEIVHGP